MFLRLLPMPPAQTDYSGQTALHVAASNGCMKAARYLVRRGASPKARDGPLTDGELPWVGSFRKRPRTSFVHDWRRHQSCYPLVNGRLPCAHRARQFLRPSHGSEG